MVGALGTLVRWAAPPSAAALLCCALCLAASAGPAQAEDEAKTLVALHKSYAGWELGDGTFNSMRVLETLQHVGADGKPQDVGQYDERRRGIAYHGTYVGTGGLRRDYGFSALVVLPNLYHGTPVVPAGLNATFGTHALLDTGDAVSVLISDSWTGTLPLLIDPGPEKYFATHRFVLGASGGVRKIECGQLERIVIGPISYDGPPTCRLAGMERENTIVGYALLKQFNYTFDYPEGKIYMRKRK